MRDLMKSHKGVSLQVQLRRVYEEKLKQSRSQLTFETVHLFMMALRECQVRLLIGFSHCCYFSTCDRNDEFELIHFKNCKIIAL